MACGDVFRKNSATDSATNIEETAHKMYNSVIGKENGYGKGNKASKRKMETWLNNTATSLEQSLD